jgi:membrane carboxypeptidase/penicillin-binding protein
MKEVLVGRPSQAFLPPPGVVQVTVDPASGEVAHVGCPTRLTEVFIEGTEPKTFCSLHNSTPVEGEAIAKPRAVSPREMVSPSSMRPEATSP